MKYRIFSSFTATAFVLSACTTGPGGDQAAGTAKPSREAHQCFLAASSTQDLTGGLSRCRAALATTLTDEDRAATLINSGVLEYQLQEPKAALSDFQAGVAVKPELGDGYTDIGVMLGSDERYSDAVTAFDTAIAKGATHLPEAYYNRAIAKEYLKDIIGAYNDYKKALELNPDFDLAAEQLKRFRVTPRKPALQSADNNIVPPFRVEGAQPPL